MKDWKDIIYEEELVKILDEVHTKEDNYSQFFHIDHRTVDKVQRIPINFNT